MTGSSCSALVVAMPPRFRGVLHTAGILMTAASLAVIFPSVTAILGAIQRFVNGGSGSEWGAKELL